MIISFFAMNVLKHGFASEFALTYVKNMLYTLNNLNWFPNSIL
jgi:hypothetical protein